jgi:hypothetical protein
MSEATPRSARVVALPKPVEGGWERVRGLRHYLPFFGKKK